MKDLKHLEVSDYFQILWKRRWYALAVFVLVVSGAAVYSWLVPDVFQSETRVMVETPLVSENYVRPTVQSTAEDRIGSIREQLASRTFLERMIEQFQMYGYGTRSEFVMENAVKAARKQIGIQKTSDNTFTIAFVSPEPQFAQMVTRQLAQEVIRISNTSRKNKVLATDQFIDEQLRQSKAALTAQEEKIARFKSVHLGELPEQGNANMSALNGLHSQLTAIENAMQQAQERDKLLDFKVQERKRLNLLSQRLSTAEDSGKPAPADTKTSSSLEAELEAKKALLEQYMAKYTPNHPDVLTITRDVNRLEQQIQQQKSARNEELAPATELTAETGKKYEQTDQRDPMEASFQFEADGIKAEIARREKEKKEILKQINLYQSRLNLAPSLDQELATLMREWDAAKTQYDNLQKQKFSTQMATTVEVDKKNETYRIIDEANLPVKAQYPNRLQIVLLGIGGGLLLGFGAAFGRELLDTAIASEEEAKRVLNLPVLVTIPTVPKAKKRKIA
jgi:polysaccharide chain length determinant protein (PEP-CTERM system associated)